ncbi:MAG: corrinoid protein [Thermacetogeniaceae bacterium]|jgi:methanogenic corrinoid protein MtbC1|nr:cobalamin-binding protein [Syntrophomonadaceae bacterium]
MALKAIYECVNTGERDQIEGLVQKALSEGYKPADIINNALIKAMDEIGQKMKDGDIFVPEVLMAANTMKSGLQVLKPLMEGEDREAVGKIAIGTVAGDLHDIGKNLVVMMLEGAGFEVIDLGVDVSIDRFLQVIEEEKPDIIGLSALLTTTMKTMGETVQAIGGKVKTMVGGAPVTEEFAKEVGASGYAPDAVTAVDLAKSLIS